MSTSDKPSYIKLFGNIDFKSGDKARSVYSPSAYLTDLLQLVDDEIMVDSIAQRRSDIENITLDYDNTFELTPYLDIVNEQLEDKLVKETSSSSNGEDAYEILQNAFYPITQPFDLANERVKLYSQYLELSGNEFYKNIGLSINQDRISIDYLGMSESEKSKLLASIDLSSVIHFPQNDTTSINVKDILSLLEISYQELRDLVDQNLSDNEIKSTIQSRFAINRANGYFSIVRASTDSASMDSDNVKNNDESLVRRDADSQDTLPISIDNDITPVYKFIYLTRKSEFSITDLDYILRHCCGYTSFIDAVQNDENYNFTLRVIAVVKWLKETYSLSVEETCALASTINTMGFGDEEDYPQDLFNQVYNGRQALIEKKYIAHQTWGDRSSTGVHPPQYYNIEEMGDPSKEYRTFSLFELFSGDILDNSMVNGVEVNSDIRHRIQKSLGLSKKQFFEIVRGYRSRENEKYDDDIFYDRLWRSGGENGQQENLLNTFYRTKKLMNMFGINHGELFTLLDIIEHDAAIRFAVFEDIFIDFEFDDSFSLEVYNPYDIMRGASPEHSSPAYRLWLIQILSALVNWLNSTGLSVSDLLEVTTGAIPRDLKSESGLDAEQVSEVAEKKRIEKKVSILNQVYKRVDPVLLNPQSFKAGSLDGRLSRLVYNAVNSPESGLICPHSARLVRFDQEASQGAARQAIDNIVYMTTADFLGLGIEERVAEKIYQNLIIKGYLSSDGLLNISHFPRSAQEFNLESDFSSLRDRIFDKISEIHSQHVDAAIYPSNLEFLQLTTQAREELYHNLIFNRYLDEDGTLLQPATFESPENKSLFEVNSRIESSSSTGSSSSTDSYVHKIHEKIRLQLHMFEQASIMVSQDDFSSLKLSEVELNDLIANLIWNEYLTENGEIRNKNKLLTLSRDNILLSVQFYPYQQQIIEILSHKAKMALKEYATFDETFFTPIADQFMAQWVFDTLNNHFLDAEGRLHKDSVEFFSDEDNITEFDVSWPFSENDNRIVFNRVLEIVKSLKLYRFTAQSLLNLDFNDKEAAELLQALQSLGYLDSQGGILWSKLDYFLTPENALLFNIETFEDYNKDVFFLLHGYAKRLVAVQTEVADKLSKIYNAQSMELYGALQDVFAVDSSIVSALTRWIFATSLSSNQVRKKVDYHHEKWLVPLLTSADADGQINDLPENIEFNKGYGRIKRFAKLAAKLKLTEHEIDLLFHDQNLQGKLSENIQLPLINLTTLTGQVLGSESNPLKVRLDRIDALLESNDGHIYIFRSAHFVTSSVLASTSYTGNPPKLPATYWVYSPVTGEFLQTKDNKLATLLTGDENAAINLENVKAAYVDNKGRDVIMIDNTCYCRESGNYGEPSDYNGTQDAKCSPHTQSDHVAEISEQPYRANKKSLRDAKFNRNSGKYHQLPCINGNTWQVMDKKWGRLADEGRPFYRVDAAFTHVDGHTYLIEDDRIARYKSMQPVKIDDGYPKKTHDADLQKDIFKDFPEDFTDTIDAALDSGKNSTFYFKGSEFIDSAHPEDKQSVIEKWGQYKHGCFEFEHIDTAFAYAGKWYVLRGEYIYAYRDCMENTGLEVMEGFPQKIIDHFGTESGLPGHFYCHIDSACVIDDKIVLFRDQEFVIGEQKTSEDKKYWTFGTTQSVAAWGYVDNELAKPNGICAALAGLDGRTYLFGTHYYYRYSQRDYYQADVGYPRAIKEDWAGLEAINAAFVWDGKTYLFGKNSAGDDVYVRYSSNDYTEVDSGYPKSQQETEEFLWNLPVSMVSANLKEVDAIFNAPDEKTYLFSGSSFVYYDHTQRWWSEPKSIAEQWPGIDVGEQNQTVVAAFCGKDQKTYIFVNTASTTHYYRFSGSDYCRPDAGYPRRVESLWGNIRNNIADCEKIDAAVTLTNRELKENADDFFDVVEEVCIYTFCRDQVYRYRLDDITINGTSLSVKVAPGYPKPIKQLHREPRFRELSHMKDFSRSIATGIDAVFSDTRNVYLFKDSHIQILSDRCHGDIYPLDGMDTLKSLLIDEGGIYAIDSPLDNAEAQWTHVSSLEGEGGVAFSRIVLSRLAQTPALLHGVPTQPSNTDAVLKGVDGNTYVFYGNKFYNKQLNRSYDLADYWGRNRSNIYDNNHVDAAFTGADEKLYVFSGDQFYIYQWDSNTNTYSLYREPGNDHDWGVHLISERWHGLTHVAVAYRLGERTYLCEKPGADGRFRYVSYLGSDCTHPEQGVPQLADETFWGIPQHLLQRGWREFDTIIVENNHLAGEQTLLFIRDREFLQYNVAGAHWFEPRPLEALWPNLPCQHELFDQLETAFIDPTGNAHFFGKHCYSHLNNATAVLSIRDVWGRVSSELAGAGKVDAAYVSEEGLTYLFFGKHYVRYSGSDYRYTDQGYPKIIAQDLRGEPGFEHLPERFETDVSAGSGYIRGIVANRRNTYIITDKACYLAARTYHVHLPLKTLSYRRNNLLVNKRIDAALFIEANASNPPRTYLFCGDQYLRYSGHVSINGDHDCIEIDPGYPKRIAVNLTIELQDNIFGWGADFNVDPLFAHGIDAAVSDSQGNIYLFRDNNYQYFDHQSGAQDMAPISEHWGIRENPFYDASSGDYTNITTAFVDGNGGLFAINGQQVIRYKDTEADYIETGYPQPLSEVFHQLPGNFADGIDNAFTYAGKLYLVKQNDSGKLNAETTGNNDYQASYIRYPSTYLEGDHFSCLHTPGEVSQLYPAQFAPHWSNCGDFRIYDLQRIFRYKDLSDTYSGEHTLLDVLRISGGYAKQPYRMLAEMFGWNVDDIKWLKRNNKLTPLNRVDEQRFKLEEIEKLFDILNLRDKLDADIITLFKSWNDLYNENGGNQNGNVSAAADQLLKWLLSRHAGSTQGKLLEDEVHNKLNKLKRDALLDFIIKHSDAYQDARDVYQDLLIDIEMGESAATSRVKEAISALQLYWHRSLINLEDDQLLADNPQQRREILKERWQWMRNYRVWEANRKVFLYPENYLRPELREEKTPEFENLEQQLLQGELTENNIKQAYQHYIDRFNEISRLSIAGGYVFDDPETSTNSDKKAIIFGHTKSEPVQHFYRFATFFTRTLDNGSVVNDIDWEPWKEVDVKIDTQRVYPVYTQNKVFVFWAKIETRSLNAGASKLNIKNEEDTGEVSAESTEVTESVLRIYYSYYNLNGGWVPAQKLNYEITSKDTITNYFLEFSGEDTTDDILDGIKIRCHFNSESELEPQPNADGLITAHSILKLLNDENSVVYLKSVNDSEEYFVQYQLSDGENEVSVARIIPGDGLPASSGFHIRNSNFDEGNSLINIESNIDEGHFLTHTGNHVQLSDTTDNNSVTGTANSSFSLHLGLVGKGYTLKPITAGNSNTVLYFGEDRIVRLAEFESLETFSEQRNASFKLISNRKSKQNNFRFHPDTNIVTELKEGAVNIGQSVYQSGFDVFNRLFPNEYTDYVSLPVLIGLPDSDTNYPWVGFDYKGGSFICKPSVSAYLNIEGTRNLPDNAEKSNVDAAFYHQGKTYLFSANHVEMYTGANADAPFSTLAASKSITQQWWDDGNDDQLNIAIDSAFSQDGIIYLTRGNKYVRFATNEFDTTSIQSEYQMGTLSDNDKGLPTLWNSIDAAFTWNNHRYFVKENQYVSSDDISSPKDLSTLLGLSVSDNFISENRENITGVFLFQESWYIVLDNTHIFLLPKDKIETLQRFLDKTYDEFSDMNDYNKINDHAISVFIFNGYLYIKSNNNSRINFGRISLNEVMDKLEPDLDSGEEIVSAYHVLERGIVVLIYVKNGTAYTLDQLGTNNRYNEKQFKNVTGNIYAFHFRNEVYFVSSSGVGKIARNKLSPPPFQTMDWSDLDHVNNFSTHVVNASIISPNAIYSAGENLYLHKDNYKYIFTVDDSGRFLLDSYITINSGNNEHAINAAFSTDKDIYIFKGHEYYKKRLFSDSWGNSLPIENRWPATRKNNNIRDTKLVDAAFVKDGYLYLTSGDQYYKYDLSPLSVKSTADQMVIPNLLSGYPKLIKDNTDALPPSSNSLVAAFTIPANHAQSKNTSLTYYVYSQGVYAKQQGTNTVFSSGNLQKELLLPKAYKNFNAALNIEGKLLLFVGAKYFEYSDATNSLTAYENTKYDIIRLSSMTGSELSRKLFLQDGIDKLMNTGTQEINERPMFIIDTETIDPEAKDSDSQKALTIETRQDSIKIVTDGAAINGDMFPVDSHLEFRGANGQYYWEMFYHAPMLIANVLNTAQKFEQAKHWYEYIFDPTATLDYWNFLPFTAVDIGGMVKALKSVANLIESSTVTDKEEIKKQLNNLVTKLSVYSDAFLGRASLSETELTELYTLHQWNQSTNNFETWDELSILESLLDATVLQDSSALSDALTSVKELIQIIKRLPVRYQLMVGFYKNQLQAYLDDPFDPHAIANLRRIAYRRTTVMAYIDNLLDWGDALFRQYTRESINEARMLYVLAYDLLGKKPQFSGQKALSKDSAYKDIRNLGADGGDNDYDFLFDSPAEDATVKDTSIKQSLTHAGIVHESIGNPYFYVPENTELLKYWQRIEDRLYKIRHSLNILGVKQTLPLFQPPIDPLALVNASASGTGLSAAMAGLNVAVPHYRFNFMLSKARELTDRVTQFGNDLLGNIEKKEAEALSILQNRQEGLILKLSRDIKEAQLKEAEENLKNLQESKRSAEAQKAHYQELIDAGMIDEEEKQAALMTASSYIYIGIPALEIASAIANAAPNVSIGPPFASNVSTGGSTIGAALGFMASAAGSVAETLNLQGEIAGMRAQFKRTEQDWKLQLKIADSEIQQLDYQIEGAKWAIRAAEQELVTQDKEAEHNDAINTFMKSKFSNEQLYQWMTSKLSGLYFQTYQMAYDFAKGAEKAYVFERGLPESEVNFVTGAYWDSLHKGLLSGDSLGHDLNRMEKAYLDSNARGFEITKTFSLAELDPIALLKLKDKKVCEFSLSEEVFDYDFPGHYNRRTKSVAVKILAGEGKVVNATLTQLNNKAVIQPDINAVKYLIEPKETQPTSIRADWRPSQQIAVSQPDQYTESSSGLFELNLSDDRYLPFEGTGAISRWRLALSGKKGSYQLSDITDVQIELQYTAKQGGEAFADAVKGLLKPYDSAVHINLATSFPNEFFAWTSGETEEMEIVMTKDRFPNMVGNKLTAVYPLFEVENGGQITITLNNDNGLNLRSGKLVFTSSLTVSERGEVWRLSAKGKRSDLINAAFVFAFKASVS